MISEPRGPAGQSAALGVVRQKTALKSMTSFFSRGLALLLALNARDEFLQRGPSQLIELDELQHAFVGPAAQDGLQQQRGE